ncbi:MAG TPA: hypothetical protein VGK22_10335 [Candidatus Angelobacter sp.]|jgi:hypothetical protein
MISKKVQIILISQHDGNLDNTIAFLPDKSSFYGSKYEMRHCSSSVVLAAGIFNTFTIASA